MCSRRAYSSPTWTRTPSSSRSSRASAARSPSPASTLPPGNSHRPARHQHLAAALDERGHDEDPAFQGSSPREKSTPALETMKAAPGMASGAPENPDPGSNAPLVRPVTASTAIRGPRSSATSTSPPLTAAGVAYRSLPSESFQSTLPFERPRATSAPFPLAYTRGPSTSTWLAPGSGAVHTGLPLAASTATTPALVLAA